MKKLNKQIILVVIFCSLFNFYLITQLYSEFNFKKGQREAYEKEKLYQKYASKLPVNKEHHIHPLTINPYDYALTYIENLIIWFSCIIWVTNFIYILKKSPKCNFNGKTINRGSLQYIIKEKLKRRIGKNAKK